MFKIMKKLIKTMIVEDERIILDDLLAIIDWKAEGFDIVATAPNGKIGLRQYELYQPELILSDIRMPLVNGLTMMKSIKLKNPSIHFLILSAFDEFDYAKDAIRLGAEDYILKTEISQEYLHEKLQTIYNKMNHETDTAITAFEKKLVDYISTPMIHCIDDLNEVFETIAAFHTPALFEQIYELSCDTVYQQFTHLGVPDKFKKPELSAYADLKEWLYKCLKDLEEIDNLVFKKQYPPIIINAHEYIYHHYMEPDLKLQTIANHVGLSSGRLSVLFKKETGRTVNDVITDTRIQKAKELLSSGRYKVYEVSELVGYKTSQYFSTIFFHQTGQYPNQYRKGLDQ